ncbi:MAG: protein jag [Actinomycetes bacterium]
MTTESTQSPEALDTGLPEAPVVAGDGTDEDRDASAGDSAGDASPDAEGGEAASSRVARLENEGDIAADYLEGLLDIADLDGDIDMDVEGSRASVSIVGADLAQLVGRDGEVLEALQELTRLAVQASTGERSRLMLDVSGFRAKRKSDLQHLAEEAITKVRASGERLTLEAMTPFERKVVHDAVAAAGLRSESEGVEPQRRVVVLPS